MGALASKIMLGSEIPDPDGDAVVEGADTEAFLPIEVFADPEAEPSAPVLLPEYADGSCACMKVVSRLPDDVRVEPGEHAVFDTGLRFRVPVIVCVEIRAEQQLAERGIVPAPTVLDCTSDGTLKVVIFNHGGGTWKAKHGDTIALLYVTPRLVSPDLTARPTLRLRAKP